MAGVHGRTATAPPPTPNGSGIDIADPTITIDARFNGPPTSANGGYAAGLLARWIDGDAAEVTLSSPPPLERPLRVAAEGETVHLWDTDTLVATAVAATVDVVPPAVVALEQAERAVQGYRGFVDHGFPTCVVCGPHRDPGDGLRLFPGPVADTPVVAAPWTPASDLADPEGHVRDEIVWAALDCPSYFGGVTAFAVLGRIAAALRAPVRTGRPHVVLGWGRGTEGRKHHAAAAITDADGEVLAVSATTWIEPRDAGST